jgi:hypothetical protein
MAKSKKNQHPAKSHGWTKCYGIEEAKKFAGVEGPLGPNNKGELRKIWSVAGQEKKSPSATKYYWASKIAGPDPNLLKATISKKRTKRKFKKEFA